MQLHSGAFKQVEHNEAYPELEMGADGAGAPALADVYQAVRQVEAAWRKSFTTVSV